MLAEPGSMIDCLNYELLDFLGYARIGGYTRYDGSVYATDIPSLKVYTHRFLITGGSPPLLESNVLFEDGNGTVSGFLFYADITVGPGPDYADATYISFTGSKVISADFGTWTMKANPSGDFTETAITPAQFSALDTALRAAVGALPATAVGLQWHRNNLFAVVPQLMIPYSATNVNEVVGYTIGATVTTTLGSGTAVLRDKVVSVAAGVSTAESGWLVVQDLGSGSLEALVDNTHTLGGAVTVAAGSVYHQAVNLKGMTSTACSIYRAQRPELFNVSDAVVAPGWIEQGLSYTAQVTLSGVTTELRALRRGSTAVESTYYFDDGTDTREIQLLDWYVISGSYAGGDAVLAVQFAYPGDDITTAFDLYSDAGATIKLGDVTTRMSLNSLPGYPQLKAKNSRYQFKNANFYASDNTDAIYGVSGASRGFVMGGATAAMSFIYTQADAALDIPRHVEYHVYHLALGFQPGSVQLSVVGQPTNFDGAQGASEHGVGDILTGLMSMPGVTLAIFCASSIHSLVGAVVDSFSLQVLAPNTGCVEYTLVDMGEPMYLDNRGVCVLSTSANYGDFVDGRLSEKVSSYLRRKLRKDLIGKSTSAGVACAIPVREKNQYRIFFNDGSIVTVTMKGSKNAPGFTFQKYFLDATSTEDFTSTIVPIAWTSEVDDGGVERMFVSHYNEDAVNTSNYVYALDAGDSFDGNYIPHYFTTNWYHTENPAQFQTLQAVRLHGLSKGKAGLKVQAAGAQNDMVFNGTALSTTTTPINLPRTPANLVSEYQPVTNRADIAARGLAVQLKFSGSNTDLAVIEPSHVAQVLITYSTPDGAFDL
jgi:hypothetical protein